MQINDILLLAQQKGIRSGEIRITMEEEQLKNQLRNALQQAEDVFSQIPKQEDDINDRRTFRQEEN